MSIFQGFRSGSTATAITLIAALFHPLSSQTILQASRDLMIEANSNDLVPIRSLAISRRGTIAILQDQDWRILFFDSNGKRLGSFGRQGEGPGEFGSLGVLGWIGDTAWVADNALARVTFIGPEWKLVRTQPIPRVLRNVRVAEKDQTYSQIFFAGLRPDGGLLYNVPVFASPLPAWLGIQAGRDALGIVAADQAGNYLRTLSLIPDIKACTLILGDALMSVPYCATVVFAVAANGSRVLTLTSGTVTRREGQYRVVVINGMKGDTTIDRIMKYQPTLIPQGRIDSLRKAEMTKTDLPLFLREAYQKMAFPLAYPQVRNVVLGMDGTIWTEDLTLTGLRKWRVLDAKGGEIGVVSLPRNFKLMAAERHQLWGVEEDEDGLGSVVRFRVR